MIVKLRGFDCLSWPSERSGARCSAFDMESVDRGETWRRRKGEGKGQGR